MKIAAFASLLFLSAASPALAADLIVNSTRDRVDMMPGDGICWTGFPADDGAPECTLRAAVHEANAVRGRAGNIVLPAGIFQLTLPADPLEEQNQFVGEIPIDDAIRNGDLDLYNYITFTGAGEGVTIIASSGGDRVFDIWSHFRHLTTFQRLTIQGGRTPGPGGCIFNRGGGTTTYFADVTIQNCVSQDQVGGGMYNAGHIEMRRVTFRGNTALRGAGLESSNLAFIYDSTFDGNFTTPAPAFNPSLGGGIANLAVHGRSPRMVIQGTTISNNVSDTGGGIINRGSLSITNSTISGNRSANGAGIAYLSAANPAGYGGERLSIAMTTIANNDGWGVWRRTDAPFGVGQSIIAGNRGIGVLNRNCDAGVFESTYNLESGRDCLMIGEGDIGNVDPLLGPLANNGGPTLTHALLAGSPAIDAGRASGGERIDQRGVRRPLGAANDIGAFEYGFDPASMIIDIPLEWEDVFQQIELTGGIAFEFSLSLRSARGKDGDAPARLLGLKAGEGQDVKYVLDNSGRHILISGVAHPLKSGDADANPVLFYLQVQRPAHGAALLTFDKVSCGCDAKPAKVPPVVIPPVRSKRK